MSKEDEAQDLIRRAREIDAFAKSFVTSFDDDLGNQQEKMVEEFVYNVETAVSKLESGNIGFAKDAMDSVEQNLPKFIELVEDTLEKEAQSMIQEIEDLEN